MGFRNPITSAAAVDTGRPAGAGARLYEGSDVTGVFGVLEFRDGIDGDAPATVTGRANLVAQGGGTFTAQGGGMTLGGGSYSGKTAPSWALQVESAPAGGYRRAARLTNADIVVMPDGHPVLEWGEGSSPGVLSGALPPAGQALQLKFFTATLTGNASGDAVVTIPGGGFANALCAVTVTTASATADNHVWLPYGYTKTAFTVRCFQVGSSTPTPSPTLGVTVMALGY